MFLRALGVGFELFNRVKSRLLSANLLRFVRENGKISLCFKLCKQSGLAGQIWLSAREKVSVYVAFGAVMRSKSVRGGVFR